MTRFIAIALAIWGSFNLAPGFALHAPHYDFNAFRCAGDILRSGGDPYRQAAMLPCQAASGSVLGDAGVAVPAPQPPPILALFVVLSLLSPATGWIVWSLLSFAATFVAIVWTARATQTRVMTAAAAIGIVAWVPGAWVGAASPFAFAGIAGALLAARAERWPLVVLGLTCAAIQPNLAVAAWLGAFVLLPKTRAWIAAAAALLFALGIATMGLSGWREWIAAVVPAHQLAEQGAFAQLGWISVFGLVHLSGPVAMRLALVIWIAAIGSSIVRLVRADRDPVRGLAYPLAAGVAFAPFLHVQEIAFAAPALLLMTRTPLVCAGLLLISGAWFTGYDVRELQPLAIAGTVWLAMDLGMSPIGTLLACVAESLLSYGIHTVVVRDYHLTVQMLRDDIATLRAPSGLTEDTWARYQVLQGNPAIGYVVKAFSIAAALLAFGLQWRRAPHARSDLPIPRRGPG